MALREFPDTHATRTHALDEQGEYGSLVDPASYTHLEDPDVDIKRWEKLAEEFETITTTSNLDGLL